MIFISINLRMQSSVTHDYPRSREKRGRIKKKRKTWEKKIWQKAGASEARAHETFALTYFSFFFLFVHIIIKPTSSRCYGERMRHRIRSTQTRHILLPRLYFIVRTTAMVIDFVIEYNVKNSVDFNIFINFNSRMSFMLIAGWVFIEYYVVRKSEII